MRSPRHTPGSRVAHIRRTWCVLAVAMSAMLCLFSFDAIARDPLRVLAWPGYADADIVQQFEQITGVQVQVTVVNSDDELWGKVSGHNGADYDVFAVNTAELQRYIDQDLAVPVDLQHVPNHARQLPRFHKLADIPGLVRGDKVYAIPYTYAEMGLIYNRKLVPQPPQSLAALWDPAYRGRVLAYNTSNHNFSLAGILLGAKNPFRLDREQMHQAAKKLVGLRRNVLAFYSSPEEAVQLYRQNEVAIVFANYGRQQLKALQAAGADVGYVIPREGALAWLDCWAVTRGARDKRMAERWLNFMLEKHVSQTLTNRQGLANTITPSGPDSAGDKLIWLEPLEDFHTRMLLWNRIMAGDGPEKF
ncbi:extracellular solute-binding protein [Oxalobacteraceae bacterium OM1]|nr:extracellular solute-binding protein [Oxalobacteraceae bacterium OM1]